MSLTTPRNSKRFDRIAGIIIFPVGIYLAQIALRFLGGPKFLPLGTIAGVVLAIGFASLLEGFSKEEK